MKIQKEFSEQAWPGFVPWLLSVLGSVAVFEFLALLAWRRESGAFNDLTFALVIIPAGTLFLLLFAALIWRFLATLPLLGSLAWLSRILPLAWGIPVFDLIRTYGNGLVVTPSFIDGKELLIAKITGSLLPMESGISVGIRLGVFSSMLFIGLVIWHFRKNILLAAAGALAWSFIVVKFIFLQAELSLWHRITSGASAWMTAPGEVKRHVALAVSDGYWWNNLYERFPSAIESQTEIAIRLTGAGLIMLALGILLILVFTLLEKRWRRVLQYAARSAGSFDIAFYVFLGVIFAATLAHASPIAGTWWIAILLFWLSIAALRISSVLRRDISHVSIDEAKGRKQPIVTGDLSMSEAKDGALLFLLYALLAGWVLGWPILAMFLVFIAAGYHTRDKAWQSHPWMPTIYRAIGAGALALSGLMFVTQDTETGTLAMAVLFIAAAHRLLIELVWIPRTRKA